MASKRSINVRPAGPTASEGRSLIGPHWSRKSRRGPSGGMPAVRSMPAMASSLGVDWSKPNMSQHVAGLLKSGAWSRGLKGAWLPHIPQEWRRFVARALHQDVAKRFRDAGEMLTAVAGLPTSGGWTCRFSPSQVVWKRARGPREQVVVWDRTPHLDSVRAFSKSASGPDGEKVLMRERPVEGRKAALAALQDFFATRSS